MANTELKKVTIFAGAGASKAVSPENYPTTVEFFERLPERIKEDNLFKKVVEFLEGNNPNKKIDIELLLWRLDELRQFCHLYQDNSSLPGWLLANNRLSRIVMGKTTNIRSVDNMLKKTTSRIDKLISDINANVYDFYSRLPTSSELEQTWSPLLTGLNNLGANIELVTTNYDMIIETALEKNKEINIGWKGNVVRTIDKELWRDYDYNSSTGLLTKLHGSINWTKRNDEIYVSDPNFTGNHDSHFIIYPGFKGQPSGATFQSFHNYFDKKLSISDLVIFIGFAFRDSYINTICEKNLDDQKLVIVLNPDSQINIPFEADKAVHLKKGFNKDSVKEIFKMISEYTY